MGGENISLHIKHRGQHAFSNSGYADLVTNATYNGGVVRQHGNLSFARVFQAGHLRRWYTTNRATRADYLCSAWLPARNSISSISAHTLRRRRRNGQGASEIGTQVLHPWASQLLLHQEQDSGPGRASLLYLAIGNHVYVGSAGRSGEWHSRDQGLDCTVARASSVVKTVSSGTREQSLQMGDTSCPDTSRDALIYVQLMKLLSSI